MANEMIRPKARSTCTDPEAIEVLALFRQADQVGLGLDWFHQFLVRACDYPPNVVVQMAEQACKDLNV